MNRSSCRLKALVAIPKVQPRFAMAIGKKYPTMKSLLSVYMDATKSVSAPHHCYIYSVMILNFSSLPVIEKAVQVPINDHDQVICYTYTSPFVFWKEE